MQRRSYRWSHSKRLPCLSLAGIHGIRYKHASDRQNTLRNRIHFKNLHGTAFCPVAQQVIDGLVKVNDTINAYLPDYIPVIQSDDGVPLTLRHSVSHTAGFPRETTIVQRRFGRGYFEENNPYAKYSEQDLLDELEKVKVDNSMIGQFRYSNFGMHTLAYILAKKQNLSIDASQRPLLNSLA